MERKGTRDREPRNALASEKNLYLLQHANNPVDWYPWGAEAFDKARHEDKPLFLSIGYSTCHWCHVMAHESFEDPEIARMMNDAFVNVKVDREERPDIDDVYMEVCQAMTGQRGWPLSIVMTPDARPFFAATYIPKETRFGRTGMLELIPRIQETWRQKRAEIDTSAAEIVSVLRASSPPPSAGDINASAIQIAYEELICLFDDVHGGFGSAPKFPTPHSLMFLLRYWKRTGEHKPLQMVEKTLQAMRHGGLWDHVGFGFHRYSTDAEWLVPHFEKMLYDQALLGLAYSEAYQATGNDEYARVVRELFSFVSREMTSSEGGFYTAIDADSEGEEGKFYLWRLEELERGLTAKQAQLACIVFNLESSGNYSDESTGERTGKNILHITQSVTALAAELKIDEETLRNRNESIRQRLYEQREKRAHPVRDDKVLADWNGLMIASLAKGARALGEPRYAAAAVKAADFILERMRDREGQLLHRYRKGEARVTAALNDYAFLIWGLSELYETTFETRYLAAALELVDHVLTHFKDDAGGGFYSTADYAESLILRTRDVFDGALPSGNSAMLMNLTFLGHLTGRAEYFDEASRLGRALSHEVDRAPQAHTHLLSALDLALGPSYETFICGDSRSEDTQRMLRALGTHFLPCNVVVFRPAETEHPEIAEIAPSTKVHMCIDGKPTAYVCQNYACNVPTTDTAEMLRMLEEGRRDNR
ncbi:MAG TPA: thioredoxin domain-containing protein [Candidatus Bathyarchaeia archaeon]|nr:thioredoxin domain-containing protein [Candidatus Bathyarchaeia archaeon]